MERKIGEIFEYNGEWYQCVESDCCEECSLFTTECDDGKSNIAFVIFGICSKARRHDNRHAIFKKLEKVGEPYEFFTKNRGIILFQKYKMFTEPYINRVFCNIHYEDNTIDIEIKQNKEDMEEKKQKMDKLVTDYSANKITYKEFEKSIVELYADKHTEVNKPKLKEFSLEAAKAGKPVCTRDGRKARIICFDVAKAMRPIIALVTIDFGEEEIMQYYPNGRNSKVSENQSDLMMLSEKKEGWVNVYKERCYKSKEDAIKNKYDGATYVDTIRVEWEE